MFRPLLMMFYGRVCFAILIKVYHDFRELSTNFDKIFGVSFTVPTQTDSGVELRGFSASVASPTTALS